jgi:hypothetical protein
MHFSRSKSVQVQSQPPRKFLPPRTKSARYRGSDIKFPGQQKFPGRATLYLDRLRPRKVHVPTKSCAGFCRPGRGMSNFVQFEIAPLRCVSRETARTWFFSGEDMRSGQTSPGRGPKKKVEKTTETWFLTFRRPAMLTWTCPRDPWSSAQGGKDTKKKVEKFGAVQQVNKSDKWRKLEGNKGGRGGSSRGDQHDAWDLS